MSAIVKGEIEKVPIVWIVNEAGHPYDKIRNKRGFENAELRPLTMDSINPLRPDRLTWDLAKGIVEYTQRDHYVLISGTPVVNMLTGILWLLQWGKMQLIQWNAIKREYEVSTIELENFRSILKRQAEGSS